MALRSVFGAMRRQALCAMHRRLVPMRKRGPIVSFCFDDFPRSAYTVGGVILRSYGTRGTYYVAIGLMNQSTKASESFGAGDLHSLVEDGHELASHTFGHVSSRVLSLPEFRRDVRRGRDAMREMGLIPSANFAYPFGEVTLAAKKALGQEMTSCRSIYRGVNGPIVDLNLLRANSLYGDTDRLDVVEQLVSESEKRQGWLIFYTHDVSPTPSPFGCTPALLESAISCVVRRGVQISTVAEVLADANP